MCHILITAPTFVLSNSCSLRCLRSVELCHCEPFKHRCRGMDGVSLCHCYAYFKVACINLIYSHSLWQIIFICCVDIQEKNKYTNILKHVFNIQCALFPQLYSFKLRSIYCRCQNTNTNTAWWSFNIFNKTILQFIVWQVTDSWFYSHKNYHKHEWSVGALLCRFTVFQVHVSFALCTFITC